MSKVNSLFQDKMEWRADEWLNEHREEMFKYHGSLSPCPKPPLPREPKPDVENLLKVLDGYEYANDVMTVHQIKVALGIVP